MRYVFYFWALPLGIFWAWYFLSANDFGFLFFTRETHDFAFQFYGAILNIDPASIPPMVARACVFDTGVIFAIVAFRKRRDIMAWWKARGEKPAAETIEAVQPSA